MLARACFIAVLVVVCETRTVSHKGKLGHSAHFALTRKPHALEETQPDLSDIMHFSHSSDFAHEVVVEGWWWCTSANFHLEMSRPTATEELELRMKTWNMITGDGLKVANTRGWTLSNSEDDRLVQWFATQFGFLHKNRRDMFKFAFESTPDNEFFLLNLRPSYRSAFEANVEVDDQGYDLARQGTKVEFLRFIRSTLDKFCKFDTNLVRYQPKPTMRLKFASRIATWLQNESVEGPAWARKLRDFFFHSLLADHNEFQYHDKNHALQHGSTMFDFANLAQYQNKFIFAVSIAGVYHDVGYQILYAFRAAGHNSGEGTTFDQGHEVVSLVVLLLTIRAFELDLAPPVIKTMCAVIMGTKIEASTFNGMVHTRFALYWAYLGSLLTTTPAPMTPPVYPPTNKAVELAEKCLAALLFVPKEVNSHCALWAGLAGLTKS